MQSIATRLNEGIPDRLVLGGHSFISQLGNDPEASNDEQIAIVEACLDAGIHRFDTTYQPARKALGRILDALGRRHEAKIYAWNFFTDFKADEPVGKPEPFQPYHMDLMLAQLRSSHIDCLVVIPQEDDELNGRQVELVTGWRRSGYVRSLGLWVEDAQLTRRYQESGQFEVMLRHALFQSRADRVVVAMRQVRWVQRNLESIAKGPLTVQEQQELRKLCRLAEPRWWQDLRRPRRMMGRLARRLGSG